MRAGIGRATYPALDNTLPQMQGGQFQTRLTPPGDGSLIRAALNDIARARSMSGLARDAGLDRSGLYKALSEDGNPSFATVLKVMGALGLRMRIEVSKQSSD